MNDLYFSFIVPVYNRPDEVYKLLHSISKLDFKHSFEVVVVEDGSTVTCSDVCLRFRESVNISYYYKPNSGPGESRNYGMKRAQGNYFIILDSDCILPQHYLKEVERDLTLNFVDCYGGPDAAHQDFTNLQKAINYSMTSLFTTGGIRGGSEHLDKFQPRSFNMGLSKEAFEKSGGFGNIHPGEDPDLTLRLWSLGYKTRLIANAYVYHERRITGRLFYNQVKKFGMVRVILNKWHPDSKRIIYWLPTLFMLSHLVSLVFGLLGWYLPLFIICLYYVLILLDSMFKNGLVVGVLSIVAVFIQFFGYGFGFLTSIIYLVVFNRDERVQFPHLFFN